MSLGKTDDAIMRNTCSHCGKLVPSDSLFCPYCGTSFLEKEVQSQKHDKHWLMRKIATLEASANQYTQTKREPSNQHCAFWPSYQKDSFICDKCGRSGELYHSALVEDVFLDHFIKVATTFRDLGFGARVNCLCPECARKEPLHHRQVTFSFFAEGMEQPVISYPHFALAGDSPYLLAYKFLSGANTVAELDPSHLGKASVLISRVKEVVWDGVQQPASIENLERDLKAQESDKKGWEEANSCDE